MTDERPYIADILSAIREGRIGAATALEWLELRADEHARWARSLRAHATPAMRDRLHGALDSALSGDAQDEFSRLFPPWQPLGPPLGHEEHPSQSLVYDAPDRQDRRPQPRTAASALTDDELYDALFPPQYRRRAAGAWE
jgi:hypothetical protein